MCKLESIPVGTHFRFTLSYEFEGENPTYIKVGQTPGSIWIFKIRGGRSIVSLGIESCGESLIKVIRKV